MTIDAEILKELKNFNRNVEWLKSQSAKTGVRWVKASAIIKITGWNGQQLRKARQNGEIEFTNKNGYFYNPASINPIHLKQTA